MPHLLGERVVMNKLFIEDKKTTKQEKLLNQYFQHHQIYRITIRASVTGDAQKWRATASKSYADPSVVAQSANSPSKRRNL